MRMAMGLCMCMSRLCTGSMPQLQDSPPLCQNSTTVPGFDGNNTWCCSDTGVVLAKGGRAHLYNVRRTVPLSGEGPTRPPSLMCRIYLLS